MTDHRLEALAARWREQAESVRRFGAAPTADAMVACADELIAIMAADDAEALTLAAAAKESGYSQSHLRRLLVRGRIENMGDASGPRIRRGDLPLKPGALTRAGRRRAALETLRHLRAS